MVGLTSIAAPVGDNREMRRGLVLACLWALGVTASVAVAFAAVGRVASRVAPSGAARLSTGAVERELSTPVTPPGTPRSNAGRTSTNRSTSSTRPTHTTTTGSKPTTSATVTTPPTTSERPPASSPPVTTPTTKTPTPTPTTAPHDTATTSQGGTVWTRCSGAQIVYVAAVPTSGYERTRDVEGPGQIEQWFQSNQHISRITAECSDGVVHAEVEEENLGEG